MSFIIYLFILAFILLGALLGSWIYILVLTLIWGEFSDIFASYIVSVLSSLSFPSGISIKYVLYLFTAVPQFLDILELCFLPFGVPSFYLIAGHDVLAGQHCGKQTFNDVAVRYREGKHCVML